MYIVVRNVSTYAGVDLVLGIYSDRSAAEDARTQSIRFLNAYLTVPGDDVLVLDDVPHYGAVNSRVFVLCSRAEGFGQVSQEVLSTFDSLSDAESAMTARAAAGAEWPEELFIAPVELNFLYDYSKGAISEQNPRSQYS